MGELNFEPASQQLRKPDFSATTAGRTLDADEFNMTVDVRYHDRCIGAVRAPNFSKGVDEVFGPISARRGIAEVGVKYPSGKALQDAAATPEGKASIEKEVKRAVDELFGDFCLTTDSVNLRKLKTNDR